MSYNNSIFGFRYENVKEFIKIMNAVKILDICTVHGNGEGLSICGLTSDHVIYCDVNLKKNMFQNLIFNSKEKDVTFGLKINTFCTYLSKLISMKFIDVCLTNTDEIHLSTEYISYIIKLLDIQENPLGELTFNSSSPSCAIEFVVDIKIFREAINSLLGEEIQFAFKQDKEKTLNLTSHDVTGSSSIILTDKTASGLQFCKFQENCFKYNFQKIETIFKYIFSNSVNVLFRYDGILKCRHYLLPDGYIDFVLAPQIEIKNE